MLSIAEILHTTHGMRFTFYSQGQGMETLGNYLREERQKQGKTLEHIVQQTRISRTTLQAIEDDQYEQLPPASYLRGFLKLYAHELDLNVEDLLALLPTRTAKQNNLALPKAPDLETQKKPLLKIFLVVGILCIACIWAWQMFFGLAPVSQEIPVKIVSPRPTVPDATSEHPEPPGTAENQLNSTPETSESIALPETTSEAKPADEIKPEEIPPVVPERFKVKFIARGIVWMKLQADDADIVDITLRNKERYSISATQRLTVRLGNPALIDIFYNDTLVPLHGKPGIPLDIIFPDFVQQAPSEAE